ncbi:hypothetical protein JCM11641_002293 [Rhodosporidiobolus odoratus]
MKPGPPTRGEPASAVDSVGLAQRMSGVSLEHLPHNVRLFFPRAFVGGADLCAKADVLSRSSPYLRNLLSSEVAEATPRRSKRSRTARRDLAQASK